MRLPDLGQVAIDLAHAAGIADDAIDGALRAALIVARVDEDLEDVVGCQGVGRLGRIGPGLAPTGYGTQNQQAEFLRVIGDVQIGKIAIARIAHRPDRRVHESGEARRIAEIVLDADGLAGQGRNAVRRAGDRHERRRVGGHAAVQLWQGRNRAGLRRSGKQRRGGLQQTGQQCNTVTCDDHKRKKAIRMEQTGFQNTVVYSQGRAVDSAEHRLRTKRVRQFISVNRYVEMSYDKMFPTA